MDDVFLWLTLGGMTLIFVAMIMAQTRRRKRQQTEFTEMMDGLRVGVKVKTVGGEIGIIREIREEAPGFKTVLLETGGDTNKSFITYDIQAIFGIVDTEKLAAAALAASNPTPIQTPAQPDTVQNHTDTNKRVDEPENVFEPKKTRAKSNKTNKGGLQ
ncbi:MAG: preprotein translocase subunit YajC [Firmicutes bacterium]|nr:preprotein translocase subunit YajC [Bacillota bacterium]